MSKAHFDSPLLGRKVLALDFDGVLTTNQVWVTESGMEIVSCNRSDSYGIKTIQNLGYRVVVMSSEVSPVVKQRCLKMGVECNIAKDRSSKSKREMLDQWLIRNKFTAKQTVFMGNDLNDLECMRLPMIYSIAPNDAYPEIKLASNLVTQANGGRGAVREVCDLLTTIAREYENDTNSLFMSDCKHSC